MLEELFRDRQRTMCVESRIDRLDPPYRPLFFYHVPKTGGLSFYTAVRNAIRYACKYPDRLGALGADSETQRIDSGLPHRSLYQADFALIASHHAFGFHRRFRQNFLLTAVVRDAVGRVRSAYTYTGMRERRPVSGAAFVASFRSEININRGVKQLAGQTRFDQPAAPGLFERAIENLTRDFHSYCTHHDIARLIGLYLSYYRLPNVVMDRINTTQPEYRLDSEPYRAEIEALNDQDGRLYQFVQAAPRFPDLGLVSSASHPVTVIINETANDKQSEVVAIGVDTTRLAALVAGSREIGLAGLIIPMESRR